MLTIPAMNHELFENINDAANLSVLEPNFDTARMKCRAGEQVFYDASCTLAGSLILLEDDVNLEARVDVFTVLALHNPGY